MKKKTYSTIMNIHKIWQKFSLELSLHRNKYCKNLKMINKFPRKKPQNKIVWKIFQQVFRFAWFKTLWNHFWNINEISYFYYYFLARLSMQMFPCNIFFQLFVVFVDFAIKWFQYSVNGFVIFDIFCWLFIWKIQRNKISIILKLN